MIEEWKDIEGFSGYWVSNLGRVSSWRGNALTRRILKPRIVGKPCRYKYVTLRRDNKSFGRAVHRLVLETFVGPCPSGKEADHKDKDTFNNKRSNLRWRLISKNRSHKQHNNPSSKFKTGELWLVRKLLASNLYKSKKLSRRFIAKMFMVHASTIAKIEFGKSYNGGNK
ncbi:NUMOD4 motif-containing HNH endonuclease [Candidatus Babeliales bacterium]|nr:NUMOD4 motif-containing HNH endonuclease [Candidatus Babeliales bacterium]